MKNILFVLLLISISLSYSQIREFEGRAFYLSANVGAYKSTDNSSFRNLGSARIGGGAGFGFRIMNNIFFYARAQYISKSDFTGYYDNSYFEGELRAVNSIGTANASMSQLIMNSGLQYNIFLSKDLVLGILAGLTYTMVDQQAQTLSGQIIQNISNEWFYGYFGGVSFEKYFRDSNLTLFAEGIYNRIDDSSLYFRDVLSGLNFTIGGRYYLKN